MMPVELLEDRQLLATIIVGTTADDTTMDSTLSLREAIEVSDGKIPVSALSMQEQKLVTGTVGASNTIDFKIPTTDSGYDKTSQVWTIKLQSGLPAISTNAVFINGYSQTGATENTLAQGDNAKLKIALDGAATGFATTGLEIAAPGSKVSGLDIENFAVNGIGILITAPGHVQVTGCFIGTDAKGETAAQDGTGVMIENSSNTLGGPDFGDRNIISGNYYQGLNIPDKASNQPLNIEPTGNRL
jgi:hypothetical protein